MIEIFSEQIRPEIDTPVSKHRYGKDVWFRYIASEVVDGRQVIHGAAHIPGGYLGNDMDTETTLDLIRHPLGETSGFSMRSRLVQAGMTMVSDTTQALVFEDGDIHVPLSLYNLNGHKYTKFPDTFKLGKPFLLDAKAIPEEGVLENFSNDMSSKVRVLDANEGLIAIKIETWRRHPKQDDPTHFVDFNEINNLNSHKDRDALDRALGLRSQKLLLPGNAYKPHFLVGHTSNFKLPDSHIGVVQAQILLNGEILPLPGNNEDGSVFGLHLPSTFFMEDRAVYSKDIGARFEFWWNLNYEQIVDINEGRMDVEVIMKVLAA